MATLETLRKGIHGDTYHYKAQYIAFNPRSRHHFAIIPTIVGVELEVDQRVASFFGGTGLLIVVSVALDLVQKINSHLVMRNYAGLTDE